HGAARLEEVGLPDPARVRHGRRAGLRALPHLHRARAERVRGERHGVRAGRPRRQHGAAAALLHGGRHSDHRSPAQGQDRRAGRKAQALTEALMAARKAKARRPARAKRPAAARVRPVPAGYHTVTPYLTVDDGARAIEFYARAFGAREKARMPGPGGKIMHAELRIGDSVVMLSDEFPGMSSARAPKALGGTTGGLVLYLPDVDAALQRA